MPKYSFEAGKEENTWIVICTSQTGVHMQIDFFLLVPIALFA